VGSVTNGTSSQPDRRHNRIKEDLMAVGVSHATAKWSGTLFEGSGSVTPESGVFGELPLTWEGRTDRPEGSTSPEELIASAHSACFSMALSNIIAKEGKEASSLVVKADVSFEVSDAGPRISSSHLEVTGTVPGIDQAKFEELVGKAKVGCPVSKALAGNVDITAEGKLA
jgi:osmotically inducible protein OsmC